MHYQRLLYVAAVATALVAAVPNRVTGQASPDSTAARLERLTRRLDSLERALDALRRQPLDTGATSTDIQALRSAAQRLAAEAARPSPDPGEAESRTRNLNLLNPEISVTGDVVGSMAAPSGADAAWQATPREFEFSFQAALDPYTRTKVFVTREEEFAIAGFPEEEGEDEEGHGFEIEEGYMYWVGLPGGFGAKVGKFRQEVGLYNRWHTHALLDVERPLAATTFLGEDGLIQTGAAITGPTFAVGPATQTVTVEIAQGTNDALFDGGAQFSFLGRVQSFWDLGATAFFQLGATGVTGRNDGEDLETRLVGVDGFLRYTPGGTSPHDLQLKGEYYHVRRETAGIATVGTGGYAQANFRATRRWIVGVRADWVSPYDDPNLFQVAPSLTWWQSEWVRLRLQYNHVKPEAGSGNNTVLLQFVWAMGPHKHETY